MSKKISFFLILSLLLNSFVFSQSAHAATCPDLGPGDLFKVPNNNAVYLINANGNRMYFPNADVYYTWYQNYNNITEISMDCVDNFPSPSMPPYGVNYRPGSRLIKVSISPSVYVIGQNNTRYKLESAEVAQELYGSNWASLVRDISDAYWPNYIRTTQSIMNAMPHAGMLFKVVGDDTKKIYFVRDNNYVLINETFLGPLEKAVMREISQSAFERLQASKNFLGEAPASVYTQMRDAG